MLLSLMSTPSVNYNIIWLPFAVWSMRPATDYHYNGKT